LASRDLFTAELIKSGAFYNELGNLTLGAAQQAELHTKHFPLSSNELTESAVSSPEQGITHERVIEIMDSSVYVANPYIKGKEALTYNAINSNKTDLALRFHFPSKGIEKPFTDKGVSELVTITEIGNLPWSDGQVRKNAGWPAKGEHQGEPMFAVQYMTLTGEVEPTEDQSSPGGITHKQKFEYRENDKHHLKNMKEEDLAKMSDSDRQMRENILKQQSRLSEYNYTLLLPESLAKELVDAMKLEPQVARDLGDMLVYNPKAHKSWQSNLEDWERWKPPYDEWRQSSGGTARMAFRSSPELGVEGSTIVEF
jgi:hypothetical protein